MESIHVGFDEFSSNDDRIRDKDDQGDWTLVSTQFSLKEIRKQPQRSVMNNYSFFQDSLEQFTL